MRGLFSCCQPNRCLEPEYLEKLKLPFFNKEEAEHNRNENVKKTYILEEPFSARNTKKNLAQAQLMYSALWDRQHLKWDFKYLSSSLAELENIFKSLSRSLRMEWIVQVLVMIKELKEDVHFRKILFLILGLFLDTKFWPRDMNNLYVEFLRIRLEEAELAIAEYCRKLNDMKAEEEETTCSTTASDSTYVRDFNRKMANAMKDPFDPSPEKQLQKVEFEGIAWAYELLHICEYKLRDFLTRDETLKDKKSKRNMETMEKAKPVLLESHDGEGNITYRRKDVDTSVGFKEALIIAFELSDVPENADLYEVFCDAHKTVQKVPFSHEVALLKQCSEKKLKHFHYYVYKPHCVDFLDNLGEKVKLEDGSIFAGGGASYYFGMKKSMGGGILRPPNFNKNANKKLVRFHLVSEDLVSTYSSKYSDIDSSLKSQQGMFDPLNKGNNNESISDKESEVSQSVVNVNLGTGASGSSSTYNAATSNSSLGEGTSVLPTPVHTQNVDGYPEARDVGKNRRNKKEQAFGGFNTCEDEELLKNY